MSNTQLIFPFYLKGGMLDLRKGIRSVGGVLSLDTLMVLRDKIAIQGADRETISEVDALIQRRIA